jgi:hypothetical protein
MESSRVSTFAFATVAGLALSIGPAAAADCAATSKMFDNVDDRASAHTVVESKSESKVFEVVISRNGTKKNLGIANARSPSVSYLMKGQVRLMDAAVTVKILRRDTEGSKSIDCAYNIAFEGAGTGKGKATWSLPDGNSLVCGDVAELCTDCELTCSQTFHADKVRWNTKLTISD